MTNFILWASGALFGITVVCLVIMTRKTIRPQATKDNRAQVELHIERQKTLGERMIGDHDMPSRWDLLGTLAMIFLVFFGTIKGWW